MHISEQDRGRNERCRSRTFRTAPRATRLLPRLGDSTASSLSDTLARTAWRTALGNVLDAAERLRDAPDILFLFVGAGAERERLIADASRRGLNNVMFQDMQPKETMPAVWSLCDVALVHLRDSPAFSSALPSKIPEAMAMGLPILLAAPEGEASRLVHGNGGVWVPAEDPLALANAVHELNSDRSTQACLSAASLAAAPAHSRETQARVMLQVFDMAIARSGSGSGPDS